MVLFEDNNSLNIDAQHREVFKVQMKDKIFTLNMWKDEQAARYTKKIATRCFGIGD